MSIITITMLYIADIAYMAKDIVHKLEIDESGSYLFLHEEHYHSLQARQKNEVSDELRFLSELGDEIFSIGFIIKFFREQKNWNLRKLGQESKVPFSQISLYENNKAAPEPTSVKKLSMALGPKFESAINLAIRIMQKNSKKSA